MQRFQQHTQNTGSKLSLPSNLEESIDKYFLETDSSSADDSSKFVYRVKSDYKTIAPKIPKPNTTEMHIHGPILGYLSSSGHKSEIVIDSLLTPEQKQYVLKHEEEHYKRTFSGRSQDEASVDDTVNNSMPVIIPRWHHTTPKSNVDEEILHKNYFSNPTKTKYLLN